MPQFRKKPVVIEAVQFLSGDDKIRKGVHWERRSTDEGEFLVPYLITIHEQRAYLADGDWILPEPKEGRFYPCKPDVFAATYEAIE